MFIKPAIFDLHKKITRQSITKDISAGITVGIIAIPLSIALAIASGSTPETGLWTSALAGLTAAVLSGCPQQISGPSATLVAISYSTIALYGFGGLLTATFLAGLLLILFGLLGLGRIFQFMPYPIVIGFTAGVAFVLVVGQLGDFAGLILSDPPANTIGRLEAYSHAMSSFNIYTLITGIISVIAIVLWNRLNKKIPGYLVALVLATILHKFTKWPVETIGSRFGQVSSSLPKIALPSLDLGTLKMLLFPALTIAFIVSLESLLSAVVADSTSDESHDSSMELIAQGGGNLVSSLIGGLPNTGVIARTAANIKSGGHSPISGIVHSAVIILCNLVLMPYLSMVPMTALSAVLFIVSYKMVDWQGLARIFRSPATDILIMITTFILTVILDLSTAIIASVILASILFTTRMSIMSRLKNSGEDRYIERNQTQITYEIEGALFFGFAHRIKALENELEEEIEQVILDFSKVLLIDATGINALERFVKTGQKLSIDISFTHCRPHVKEVIRKSGAFRDICID